MAIIGDIVSLAKELFIFIVSKNKISDQFIDINEYDSDEDKRLKMAHNERMTRQRITGITNEAAQKEVLKMCKHSSAIPNYRFFESFDKILIVDGDSHQFKLDEEKRKFYDKESIRAYLVGSLFIFLSVVMFWIEGITKHTLVILPILTLIGSACYIACYRLWVPSEKKLQEAQKYISDYYNSIDTDQQ